MQSQFQSNNILQTKRERISDEITHTFRNFERLNQRFLLKIKEKNLLVRKFNGQFLFENAFEVLAVLTEHSIKETETIANRTKTMIKKIVDWSLIHSEFTFLNNRNDIIQHFLEDEYNPIYFGFLLVLHCKIYNYVLKIYQLEETNSMITCEIGHSKCEEFLRIGIFHSPMGPKFAILEKTQNKFQTAIDFGVSSLQEFSRFSKDDKRFIKNLFSFSKENSEKSQNQDFLNNKSKISSIEIEILKTISKNIGVFPQAIILYSEYISEKVLILAKQKELSFLFHFLVKSVETKSYAQEEQLIRKKSETNKTLQTKEDSKITAKDQSSCAVSTKLTIGQKNKNTTLNLKKFKQCDDKNLVNLTSMVDLPTPDKKKKTKGNQTKKIEFEKISVMSSTISPIQKTEFFTQNSMNEVEFKKSKPGKKNSACQTMLDLTENSQIYTEKGRNKISPKEALHDTPSFNKDWNLKCNGVLKISSETKKIEFLVSDKDGADLFLHFRDMELSGSSKNNLVIRDTLRFRQTSFKSEHIDDM